MLQTARTLARVLVAPSAGFRDISPGFFGTTSLVVLGLIEAWIRAPGFHARAFVSAAADPIYGGLGLLSIVGLALVPALVLVAVGGVALYYALRWWGRRLPFDRALDVSTAAWVPVTLLAGVSAAIGTLGVDFQWMPHRVLGASSGVERVVAHLRYLPFAIYLLLAFRALRGHDADTWRASPLDPARRGLLAAMAVVLLGVIGQRAVDVGSRWEGLRPLLAGDAAPALILPRLGGGSMPLVAAGAKATVLDFWATWCPPCVETMPALDRLHREFGPKGLSVVAVNVEPDALEVVRQFISDRQLTMPVAIDDGAAQAAYTITHYPSVVVVDGQGVVTRVFRGMNPEARVRAEVKKLLGLP